MCTDEADQNDSYRSKVRSAAHSTKLISLRQELAHFAAEQLRSSGLQLHLQGQIVGPDRAGGTSPFGHGDDEVVAISVLLRICGELTSAVSDLFADGRRYAAAALLRQMVEIEYLAWAFETRSGDAKQWLRSNKEEREQFFRPAKLRTASEGRFRSKDYGYHCELG